MKKSDLNNPFSLPEYRKLPTHRPYRDDTGQLAVAKASAERLGRKWN